MPRTRTQPGNGPAGRQRQRRERTKKRIVEAFGRVVARAGLYNVGVNQLMREAGVGKRQIYQYFGGLGGVAAAWSRAGMRTPEPQVPAVRPAPPPHPRSPASVLTAVLLRYAEKLRANPVALAAVQSQLLGPTELSDSLREVRSALREEQLNAFLTDARLRESGYVALYSVLYAAINYCALRARFMPAFNGLDLARPEGWRTLFDMFRTVAALVENGMAQDPSPRRGRAAAAKASRARPKRRATAGRKSVADRREKKK